MASCERVDGLTGSMWARPTPARHRWMTTGQPPEYSRHSGACMCGGRARRLVLCRLRDNPGGFDGSARGRGEKDSTAECRALAPVSRTSRTKWGKRIDSMLLNEWDDEPREMFKHRGKAFALKYDYRTALIRWQAWLINVIRRQALNPCTRFGSAPPPLLCTHPPSIRR